VHQTLLEFCEEVQQFYSAELAKCSDRVFALKLKGFGKKPRRHPNSYRKHPNNPKETGNHEPTKTDVAPEDIQQQNIPSVVAGICNF